MKKVLFFAALTAVMAALLLVSAGGGDRSGDYHEVYQAQPSRVSPTPGWTPETPVPGSFQEEKEALYWATPTP